MRNVRERRFQRDRSVAVERRLLAAERALVVHGRDRTRDMPPRRNKNGCRCARSRNRAFRPAPFRASAGGCLKRQAQEAGSRQFAFAAVHVRAETARKSAIEEVQPREKRSGASRFKSQGGTLGSTPGRRAAPELYESCPVRVARFEPDARIEFPTVTSWPAVHRSTRKSCRRAGTQNQTSAGAAARYRESVT